MGDEVSASFPLVSSLVGASFISAVYSVGLLDAEDMYATSDTIVELRLVTLVIPDSSWHTGRRQERSNVLSNGRSITNPRMLRGSEVDQNVNARTPELVRNHRAPEIRLSDGGCSRTVRQVL